VPDLTHAPPPYLRQRDGVAWLEMPLGRARAVFSTRVGGVSSGVRASLDLGLHADDSVALGIANREAFCRAVDADLDSLVLVRQVHGAEILLVGPPAAGERTRDQNASLPPADGLLRAGPEPGLVVQVADCGAVAIADPESGAGAMVHAGWRGASAGIVERAVAEVSRVSGKAPDRLLAAIGPCIRGCCYEGGGEVRDAFLRCGESRARCFTRQGDRWHLDLGAALAMALGEGGLVAESILDTGACTCCRPDLFHSYRRDGEASGRLWGCLL